MKADLERQNILSKWLKKAGLLNTCYQGLPEKLNQWDVCFFVYFKTLAHAVMEANKSQDLQGKSAN